MKFFIDTANVDDIRKANDMGVICGVTTNPSLIAKEGRDFNEVIKEITTIVDGPISGEVKATTVDAEGMIKEGREIAAIHPNMVVKIPMTVEGLKAVKVLSAEGIKTNVTLIFTANQALLAARAGASYVSPFLGRLDDISTTGINRDHRSLCKKSYPRYRLCSCRCTYCNCTIQGNRADDKAPVNRSGYCKVPGRLQGCIWRIKVI